MRLKDTNLEKDRKLTFNFKVDCTINSEHSPVFDSLKVYVYLVIKAISFLTEFVWLPQKCSMARKKDKNCWVFFYKWILKQIWFMP